MTTLLLDRTTWDLVVDANGNIAVAADPYATAQDVCSAVRTWLGEVYYDTTQGIPWANTLGLRPPLSLVRAQIEARAAQVPGCNAPRCFLSSLGANRVLSGQIQFTDNNGVPQVTAF